MSLMHKFVVLTIYYPCINRKQYLHLLKKATYKLISVLQFTSEGRGGKCFRCMLNHQISSRNVVTIILLRFYVNKSMVLYKEQL